MAGRPVRFKALVNSEGPYFGLVSALHSWKCVLLNQFHYYLMWIYQISHLDKVGWLVMILEKPNVIPEHNLHFLVQSIVQHIESFLSRCLTIHDMLETSSRDLSRTGNIETCKTTRREADREFSKAMKPLPSFLHSFPSDLVFLQEKLMSKHSTVADSYEKKLGG